MKEVKETILVAISGVFDRRQKQKLLVKPDSVLAIFRISKPRIEFNKKGV